MSLRQDSNEHIDLASETLQKFEQVANAARASLKVASGLIAAQNKLSAPVLFSHKKVPELLDPSLKANKKPLERHHLFPKAWLARQGVDDLKIINQQANFALIEWPDNIDISDKAPAEYVPEIRSRFTDEVWKSMHEYHALPKDWEALPYPDFLPQRRKLMAAIIRRGFDSLK